MATNESPTRKERQMNKIACVVLVFDRPQYFAPVLESLKENADGNDVDWFFFVDGAKTAAGRIVGDEKKIKESAHLISHIFPPFPYHIETSSINEGVAKQKQKAHQLFKRYDQVIFFEDDMIVSPHYVRLICKLQNQFPNDIVNAPARRKKNIKAQAKPYHIEKVDFLHLWGYSMMRSVYEKIEKIFNQYVLDAGKDYKNRDNSFLCEKYGMKISSHDRLIETEARRKGIRRIITSLPRGKYIGEKGLHSTPALFEGFKVDVPYIFEEDASIEKFKWIS